jgi:hypothetical protein
MNGPSKAGAQVYFSLLGIGATILCASVPLRAITQTHQLGKEGSEVVGNGSTLFFTDGTNVGKAVLTIGTQPEPSRLLSASWHWVACP